MRRQGERWSSYGLRRPDSMLKSAGWIALMILLLWASGSYVAPVLANVLPIAHRADFFGYVHGNTLAFAGWVAISWLVGGFSEELLFRGFLFSQVGRMFESPVVGMATGLTAQALLFGSLHIYAGAFGFGAWDTLGMYGLYR